MPSSRAIITTRTLDSMSSPMEITATSTSWMPAARSARSSVASSCSTLGITSADVIPNVLQLDATDERALRAAGIQDVDVAVISIGEDIESSVLVVMIARELGIPTIAVSYTHLT